MKEEVRPYRKVSTINLPANKIVSAHLYSCAHYRDGKSNGVALDFNLKFAYHFVNVYGKVAAIVVRRKSISVIVRNINH